MFNSSKPDQLTGSPQRQSASVPFQTPLLDASQIRSSESSADFEERFHAFFDAAPIGIGIIRDGMLLYANPSLASLVGVSEPEQLLGKRAGDFIAPTQRGDIIEHARARIQAGSTSQVTPHETMVRRVDGTQVPVRTEISSISLPDGDAVLVFAFDLSNERRSNDEIHALLEKEQRTAHFAQQLQEFSQALSDASSPDEVALIAVERCQQAVGSIGTIFVVPYEDEQGETRLSLSQSRGYPAEAVAAWKQMNVSDDTPVAQAFREGSPIWVGDVQDAANIESFPVLARARLSGTHALVALPLCFDSRTIGVLGMTFDTVRDFDSEERIFMETLATSCAQALERARLFSEIRSLARRQRESLALLNTLLDSAPVGFGLFDREHRYVLVNEELARIDVVTVEDHIGKRPTEMPFPEEGGQKLETLLESVWQSGLPSGEVEFARGIPSDPDFIHCVLALYPIRVGGASGTYNGEMLGVGAIVIEQTARVRAEGEREQLVTQLEIERARFEAILQQMPSGVLIAEAPSGHLVLRNDQATEIWGQPFSGWETRNVTTDQLRRKGFHLDGRELQPDEWPLSRAIAGEVVQGAEVIIERGDNQFGVVRANAAPIRNSDGSIAAGIVVFDNITERSRADASQRFLADAGTIFVSAQSETEILGAIARLCVPRVTDWCAFVVPDTRTTLSITALAGPKTSDSRDELDLRTALLRGVGIRQTVAEVMESQSGLLRRVRDSEPTSWDETGTLARMGIKETLIAPVAVRGRSLGAMVWLSVSPQHPLDATTLALAGGLGRRVGLSVDNARLLQETKQTRDAAQRARDEAENANRAKDEFLAVVSHELRTPLTPILGWLELLRSPDIDDALRTQAYDVIERNAISQAQLVNDILDVSRITTGKLRLELKNVVLDEVVSRTVETLRTVWNDKKLRVEQRIEPGMLVRADDNRLGQVVSNLLQNAIKFTSAGGKIEIALHKQVRAIGGPIVARLEICDTGAGIDPEFLPHVFERFRQGDSSSTRKTGGLGLGLAIVSHIVELHGGQVGVESAGVGEGATFWVELPMLEAAQASPSRTSATRVLEGRLKGARILVVEDEPDTREMLARLLEEAGATVRVAPGGQTALEIVPQFGPALVVSDIGLPDMDGLQLRREMLERGFDMPAIALTAYASGKDKEMTQEAGYQEYLAKPVGTQELVEVAVTLLVQS